MKSLYFFISICNFYMFVSCTYTVKCKTPNSPDKFSKIPIQHFFLFPEFPFLILTHHRQFTRCQQDCRVVGQSQGWVTQTRYTP